jgi:hypothetical protein
MYLLENLVRRVLLDLDRCCRLLAGWKVDRGCLLP